MDERMRELERLAATGDEHAVKRVAAARILSGLCPWCSGPGSGTACCCFECFKDGPLEGRRECGAACSVCPLTEAERDAKVARFRADDCGRGKHSFTHTKAGVQPTCDWCGMARRDG